MQKAEKAVEPTMEEILASIRQIIAEDSSDRPLPPVSRPLPARQPSAGSAMPFSRTFATPAPAAAQPAPRMDEPQDGAAPALLPIAEDVPTSEPMLDTPAASHVPEPEFRQTLAPARAEPPVQRMEEIAAPPPAPLPTLPLPPPGPQPALEGRPVWRFAQPRKEQPVPASGLPAAAPPPPAPVAREAAPPRDLGGFIPRRLDEMPEPADRTPFAAMPRQAPGANLAPGAAASTDEPMPGPEAGFSGAPTPEPLVNRLEEVVNEMRGVASAKSKAAPAGPAAGEASQLAMPRSAQPILPPGDDEPAPVAGRDPVPLTGRLEAPPVAVAKPAPAPAPRSEIAPPSERAEPVAKVAPPAAKAEPLPAKAEPAKGEPPTALAEPVTAQRPVAANGSEAEKAGAASTAAVVAAPAQNVPARVVAPSAATVTAPAAPAMTPTGSLLPVRSLEDTVTEMLRPMLRQWLDDNMPRMVEKALKVELAESLKKLKPPQ